MPQIIPIKDLKNTSDISQLCHSTNEPIFVTKNGYGDMVIMSMKKYEQTMWMLDVYEKLAQGEEQMQKGQVQDAYGSLKSIREKYNV